MMHYIKKFLNFINNFLALIVIFLIKIYQFTLSPDKGIPSFWLKGKVCVHTPHCSKYSVQVLKRYGFLPGIIYVMDRVSSCHPWNNNHYDPDHLRVVFMCSAPIGETYLQELFDDKRFEVVGVVTNPDQPVGRGMKIQENIIKSKTKSLVCEKGLNVDLDDFIKTPDKINPEKSQEGAEFYEWLKSKNPDYLLIIAYGKILPTKILQVPLKAPINVHGSILPYYRGASPIQSVLLNKELQTGISIMHINEKMDEGDVLKIYAFDIKFDYTSKDIINIMMEKGPKWLTTSVWDHAKGHLPAVAQDHTKATYCQKFEKNDGLIDISKDTLSDIYAKYRAFYLWPKIWFVLDERFGTHIGKRVILDSLKLDENIFNSTQNQLLFNEKFQLNSAIVELNVKPEGKSVMSFNDFIKGYLN